MASSQELGEQFFQAVAKQSFVDFKKLFATKADFIFLLEHADLPEADKKEQLKRVEDFIRTEQDLKDDFEYILEDAAANNIDWSKATLVETKTKIKIVAGTKQAKITVHFKHQQETFQLISRKCLPANNKWVMTDEAVFFDPSGEQKLRQSILLATPEENEIWQAALERYAVFAPQINAESELNFATKDRLEVIENVERQMQMEFPSALKSMYLEEGAFSIGEADEMFTVLVYPAAKLLHFLSNDYKELSISKLGLAEMIDFKIGHPELKELLPAKAYHFLNENYKVFGLYYHNESDYDFYFFDKNDNFGTVAYNHDWYHFDRKAWNETFLPLAQKSNAKLSFNELVAKEMNKTIKARMEYWIENGE